MNNKIYPVEVLVYLAFAGLFFYFAMHLVGAV